MHYLPLLRPEPVKSQPTASEFNWRAQMFADVQAFLRCPCFFFLNSLESYSSAVGSLSALAWGEGTKLEKNTEDIFKLALFLQCQFENVYTYHTKKFQCSHFSFSYFCCDNIWTFKRITPSGF